MESIEKGREALLYFYNASKKFSNFNYSFDRMLEVVSGSPKAVQFFLDGMGTAIIEIQKDDFLADSKVKKAMENLANLSKGNLPNKSYFFSALSQEAQNVTFIEAIPTVVIGSAAEIVNGAQAVGDALIDTGKIVTKIFPFVTIIALLFILKEKTKKVAK